MLFIKGEIKMSLNSLSEEKQIPDIRNSKEIMNFLDTIDPHKTKFKSAYRGNPLLKKAGEKFEWTEQMVKEIIKCKEDPIYFIERYVTIIHLDRGKVPFILWDFQKEMILSMVQNRFSIFATARQVGKSTTTCAFLLWYILFNEDKVVALLANKADTAREILGKVRLSYSLLPKWMQSGIAEGGWNKGSINLENGCKIFASATTPDTVRGWSVNLLFLDEVAHVEGWEDFERSVMPTISSSTTSKIIMVSTPKGLNHFYKYWTLANKDQTTKDWNNYHPLKVNWNQVPGRDEEWYKNTLKECSHNTDFFNQEFGVEFLGSTDTLIAGWKLKELVHKTPIHYDAGLSKYIDAVAEHQYILVADCAHGKGRDYAAFNIFDISQMPFRICTTYRSNKITPYDFTMVMTQTSLGYNKAAILVENNDIGKVVTQILEQEFEYENILYSRPGGRLGKVLSGGFTEGAEAGVATAPIMKQVGCSLLKLLIEQNQLIVEDFNTIEELSTFVKKGNSWKADEGYHDDLVMTLMIFAWASDQPYFKELANFNPIKNVRDSSDSDMDNMMLPFGFLNESPDDEIMEARALDDPWAMEWSKGEYIRDDDGLPGYFDDYNKQQKLLMGEWVGT
jgi:hypothetical protein